MPHQLSSTSQNMPDSALLNPSPPIIIEDKRYTVRFAQNLQEIDAALRLRFNVFNLELNEGLESAFSTQKDEDEFDRQCDHLLVVENKSNEVIGTYRMQTYPMAQKAKGFYSADEFKLNALPKRVLDNAVEVGRACIAKAHRNGRVLFLLWKGIAKYMVHQQKQYLFGCCSLTSQDPKEGQQLLAFLEANNHLHEELNILPTPNFACPKVEKSESFSERVVLPHLLKLYLNYGAKVCGPPALDAQFKTIDYFVLLDIRKIDPRVYKMFF